MRHAICTGGITLPPLPCGRGAAKEATMKDYPVVTRLLCVALVVSVMVPAGRMAFPFLAHWLDNLEFSAVEAVVSTTLGFGLYAVLFG
jgi:hypothetical protein